MTTKDSVNRLNVLSAQDWLKFTKTWFVHNPSPRKKNELLHPAKYPENLIAEFIRFFTKPGALVFDPFLGTGTAWVVAHRFGRKFIGFEINNEFVSFANERFLENFAVNNELITYDQLTAEAVKQKIADSVMVKANNLLYANKRIGDFLQIK